MSTPQLVFSEVSKFYGEVLGVNRVTLNIPPGITSLVGPNGSGKTTLMNLMTGLIHPDHGHIDVGGGGTRAERRGRDRGGASCLNCATRIRVLGFRIIDAAGDIA